MAVALEFGEVCLRFPAGFQFGPVSQRFPEASVSCILGPSGSGKSTLLRLAGGLLKPETGRIEMSRSLLDRPGAGSPFAMVFQDHTLYPHLTVEANAVLAFQVGREARVNRRERLPALAEKLGIEGFLCRKPSELSGGERQRAAILKVLVSGAPVWLMDEPLSNLDERVRLQIRSAVLEHQRRQGAALLYVTHDVPDAMALADVLIVMDRGEVLQSGPVPALLQSPASLQVARFLASPPVNEVPCRLSEDGKCVLLNGSVGTRGELSVKGMTAPLPADGALTLVVRPEDVRLSGEPPTTTGLLAVQGVAALVETGPRRSLVEFETPVGVLRAFAGAGAVPSRGEAAWLCMDGDAVSHVFSAADGQRIDAHFDTPQTS